MGNQLDRGGAERRPLLPPTTTTTTFTFEEFENDIDAWLEEIKKHWALTPEFFYTPGVWNKFIKIIPGVLSGAAVLFFALTLKRSQSPFSVVKAIDAFAVNYAEFFIPIDVVVSGRLEYYKEYVNRLRKEPDFRKTQPDHEIVYAILRDIFSIGLGIYSSSMWPSVAKEVPWLDNFFFTYLMLYPASVALQIVGCQDLLDRAFNNMPAITDAMYIATLRRRVEENFLSYIHKRNVRELNQPVSQRALGLRQYFSFIDSDVDVWPMARWVVEELLFVSALYLFFSSNLGNFKDTALNQDVSLLERVVSLAFTATFGFFGASIFSSYAGHVIRAIYSKGDFLKNNAGKVIWSSIALIGLGYLSVESSRTTLADTYTINGTTPHTVNLDDTTYEVLDWSTIVGTAYSNGIWAALFGGYLLTKSRLAPDPFSVKQAVFENKFKELSPDNKVKVMIAACRESSLLQEFLNKQLGKALGAVSVIDFLLMLEERDKSDLIKGFIDDFAKSRQLSIFILSAMCGVASSVPLLLGAPWYTAAIGSGVSELVAPRVHSFFDKKHEALQLPDPFRVNDQAGKEQAASLQEKAIEAVKAVAVAALPLAIYQGSKLLSTWVARTMFEQDPDAAEQTGESFAQAITGASVFAVSMVRFRR